MKKVKYTKLRNVIEFLKKNKNFTWKEFHTLFPGYPNAETKYLSMFVSAKYVEKPARGKYKVTSKPSVKLTYGRLYDEAYGFTRKNYKAPSLKLPESQEAYRGNQEWNEYVMCVDPGFHNHDRLTLNKIYKVISEEKRDGFYRLKGNDGRVQYYPTRRFRLANRWPKCPIADPRVQNQVNAIQEINQQFRESVSQSAVAEYRRRISGSDNAGSIPTIEYSVATSPKIPDEVPSPSGLTQEYVDALNIRRSFLGLPSFTLVNGNLVHNFPKTSIESKPMVIKELTLVERIKKWWSEL